MTIDDEKVRRFEPRMIGIEDRPHEAGMYVSLHGHYVLHSAYAELAAELDDEREKSSNWLELIYNTQKQLDAAESQLAELRVLADSWRNRQGWYLGHELAASIERTLAAADGTTTGEKK